MIWKRFLAVNFKSLIGIFFDFVKIENGTQPSKILNTGYYFNYINFYDDQNTFITNFKLSEFANSASTIYNRIEDRVYFTALDLKIYNIYRVYQKIPEVIAVIVMIFGYLKLILTWIFENVKEFEYIEKLARIYYSLQDDVKMKKSEKLITFTNFFMSKLIIFNCFKNVKEYQELLAEIYSVFSIPTQLSIICSYDVRNLLSKISFVKVDLKNFMNLETSQMELINQVKFKANSSVIACNDN